MPDVLAVVVNYNGGALVCAAVASLRAQIPPVDVMVVDNASSDGSDEALMQQFPDVMIHRNQANIGFAQACNMALSFPHPLYFFMNPDAKAPPNAASRLRTFLGNEIAAVGATLVHYDDPQRVQEFASRPDFLGYPFDPWEEANVSALPDEDVIENFYACGGALMVRGDVFRALGGFDGSFFMIAEDLDLCWRARLLGYRVAVTPKVRVLHVGGGSAIVGHRGSEYVTSAKRIFLRERNCMIAALKCYGFPAVVVYVVLNCCALFCEAVALTLVGRAGIARAYRDALLDIWRGRAEILAARHKIQRSRRVGDAAIIRWMYRGYGKLAALRRRRMPHIKAFAQQA